MKAEFSSKTNELTISLSANPKSTEVSGSGKTFIVASDRAKINIDGEEVVVQVNAYKYVEAKKGKKR